MKKEIKNPVIEPLQTFPRKWLLSAWQSINEAIDCDRLARPDLARHHFAAASVTLKALADFMDAENARSMSASAGERRA